MACAPLLEEELAVPWEVETTVLEGPLGFGRVLADDGTVGDDELAICGSEALHAEDFEPPAVAADFGPDCQRWAAIGGDRVHTDAGVLEGFSDLRAVAVDADRVVVLECPETCRALDANTGEVLGEAGPAGAVDLWAGEAWWSDPELGERGEVRGPSELQGLPGDFLGRSLGGGYAAGVYNEDEAPGRLRLLSLDGGPTLALDRVPVNRPVVLAGDEDLLVVGLPFGPDFGRVYLVDRQSL